MRLCRSSNDRRDPAQEAETLTLGIPRRIRLMAEVGATGVGRHTMFLRDGDAGWAQRREADRPAEVVEAVVHARSSTRAGPQLRAGMSISIFSFARCKIAEMQAELLRVLQERGFRAVGEEKESRKLAARVLCATHRDMALLMPLCTALSAGCAVVAGGP